MFCHSEPPQAQRNLLFTGSTIRLRGAAGQTLLPNAFDFAL
jgi:hypothetical protein